MINRRIPTSVGTLAIADQGEGTAVVMWPSVFADHRFFDAVRQQLSLDWRCLRIDGPGFGQSQPPQPDTQPERYADAIVEVLDALNIERAVIAGCSWGGQIAAQTGVRSPERTIGVLMMNTPMAPSIGGHRAQVIGTRLIGSTRFWGRGVARAMFAPQFLAANPEAVRGFVDAFSSFDRKAATTTVRTTLTRFHGMHAVLPQLRIRTVIMMGELDTQYPVAPAMPIAELAPAARIEVVNGCGHLLPIEAPSRVVAALHSLRR